MKHLFLTILAGLALTAAVNAQQTFKVKIDQPAHGRVTVAPMENIPSAKVREVPQYLVLGTEDRTVSREQMEIYVEKLKAAGHKAELVIVEKAAHAFFDWKPDQETKDIFAKYGVPYAADMMRFFDDVFYK